VACAYLSQCACMCHVPLCSSHCICLDREFGMLHAMFFCSRSCLHMLLVLRFSLAGLGTPVEYCNSVPLAGLTAVLPCASDECRTTWRGPCTARPLAEVSVGRSAATLLPHTASRSSVEAAWIARDHHVAVKRRTWRPR